MSETERIALFLSGESVYEIDGVKDIICPDSLSSFVIVMKNDEKYLVDVTKYEDYR
ncbi:MAG: hypothetical protein LBT20_02920 [Clostridiales bacterium]|jgi:hypothetical protein|nr:hypothetical protein [Clostridiales bacterium]